MDNKPGDCKADYCDQNGAIVVGINDFDRPDPNTCNICSGGEIVTYTGALPGLDCSYCDAGTKIDVGNGDAVGECSICSGGLTVPDPTKNGAINGNQCTICDNGSKVKLNGINLGFASVIENTCRYCSNGVEEIRTCEDENSANKGTIKLRDGRTEQEINNEDTVYINEAGEMPEFIAKVEFPTGADKPESIEWDFNSSHSRRPPETCSVINASVDSRGFGTRLPTNLDWHMSDDFQLELPENTFGSFDNANPTALMASFKATQSKEFKLQILGRDPEKTDVRDLINAAIINIGSNSFWAIALHESGSENCGVMQQFNELGCNTGNQDLANTPNFGPPDGWGISQIDRSFNNECATNSVSTSQIWNWKENINLGYSILNVKLGIVMPRLRQIEAYWQNQTGVTWSEPSPPFDIGGVQVNNLTAEDICTIQAYNGIQGNTPQNGRVNNINVADIFFCFVPRYKITELLRGILWIITILIIQVMFHWY